MNSVNQNSESLVENTMPDKEIFDNFKLLEEEASVLLLNIQKGCPETIRRFIKSDHPNFSGYSTLKLFVDSGLVKSHHIKWMLAKEMGFKSWSLLKNEVETTATKITFVRDFINSATSDERCPDLSNPSRALWLLESSPKWLNENFAVALVIGKADYVISYLHDNPLCVNESFGPKDWSPLLYVAYSHFLNPKYGNKQWQANGFNQIVKALVEAGADTDASFYLSDFKKTERNVKHGFSVSNRFDLIELVECKKESDDKTIPKTESVKFLDLNRHDLNQSPSISNAEVLRRSYTLLKELEKSEISQIKNLLISGANPNFSPPHYNGKSSLHVALNIGRSDEILSELLHFGADPFLKDGLGMTPIRLGIRYGRLSFVVEIKKRRQLNENVLHLDDEFWCSVFLGRIDESQRLFIKCGMDPGKLDDCSIPLFSRAAYFGNRLAVRILLDLGFDPALCDETGMTPLHWAVWKADIIMIEWLLKSENAPLNQCNFYDLTPLDTAIIAGQKKAGMKERYLYIIRMLLAAGSHLNQAVKLFLADIDCNENDPDSELDKIFWMEGFNELGSLYLDDVFIRESVA